MPKETIYDSSDPENKMIQMGWDKTFDALRIYAEKILDDQMTATGVSVHLDRSSVDRLASIVRRIQRQAGGEPEVKTVRSVAVFDDVKNSNDRLYNLIMTSYAIQQETMNLVAAASGEISDLNPTFRAYKIDTDRLDGKSLWQENKVAYLVEMDYTVEETT